MDSHQRLVAAFRREEREAVVRKTRIDHVSYAGQTIVVVAAGLDPLVGSQGFKTTHAFAWKASGVGKNTSLFNEQGALTLSSL